MTLKQFAIAIGASTRWAQNARATLGWANRPYTEADARVLGLARSLRDATDGTLGWAVPVARAGLAAWPAQPEWTYTSSDGMVTIRVDIARYLSDFAVRLSRARVGAVDQVRGVRPRRSRDPVASAIENGIDVSLLQANLRVTPAIRLDRLSGAAMFLRDARKARKSPR